MSSLRCENMEIIPRAFAIKLLQVTRRNTAGALTYVYHAFFFFFDASRQIFPSLLRSFDRFHLTII